MNESIVPVIETRGLSKSYKDVTALKSLDLRVPELDLRLSGAERRGQDHYDQATARHRAGSDADRPLGAGDEHSRRYALVRNGGARPAFALCERRAAYDRDGGVVCRLRRRRYLALPTRGVLVMRL